MNKPTHIFTFNYEIFYNYYTDDSNPDIKTDPLLPRPILYFYNRPKPIKPPKMGKLSDKFIEIDGINIYISKEKSNTSSLLFTIPKELNGKLYDFHYHFGIRPNRNLTEINSWKFYKKIKTRHKTKRSTKGGDGDLIEYEPTIDQIRIHPDEYIIFFHKTEQIPSIDEQGNNSHAACHFKNNIEIRNMNQLICIDENDKIISSVFTEEELRQIYNIISKPFVKKPILKTLKKTLNRRIIRRDNLTLKFR